MLGSGNWLRGALWLWYGGRCVLGLLILGIWLRLLDLGLGVLGLVGDGAGSGQATAAGDAVSSLLAVAVERQADEDEGDGEEDPDLGVSIVSRMRIKGQTYNSRPARPQVAARASRAALAVFTEM